MSMITTAEIMRIAELRDGLVTRGQLRKHGLTERQISRLVLSRVLHPVFRGIYALAPPPWPLGRRALAACLASPGLVISDMTAAAHWRLRRTPRDVLEAVVIAPRLVRLPNVRVHRTNRLDERDVVAYANGLRVTSPARTLFDIAAELDPAAMTSVVEDALNRRLCTPWSLGDVAERIVGQGRPGAVVFRAAIEGRSSEMPPVGSEAELVLAEALEAAGMPPLARQVPVRLTGGGAVRLDLAVPGDRFDIEIDDPAWHADPVALQRDHARDLLLTVDGWIVQRVTTDDVDQRLHSTAATLTAIYERVRSRSLCA
jgi:very-short-patch-repair endonuclease